MWDHHWSFRLHVVVRAAANGVQVPGFWSRDAVEHVCVVGFIRQRPNVHKSEK